MKKKILSLIFALLLIALPVNAGMLESGDAGSGGGSSTPGTALGDLGASGVPYCTYAAGSCTWSPYTLYDSTGLDVSTFPYRNAAGNIVSATASATTPGLAITLNKTLTVTDNVTFPWAEKLATFNWDGGGAVVTTGATTKRCVQIPYAATITGVFIKASQSSTLTITPYKDAFSTSALATTGLISGAGTTGLTTALGVNDTTLTNWTKTVSANDEVCAQVTTNNNALWITMQIYGTR